MNNGIKHGTYAGYQKHKVLRIKPCDECREAAREYMRKYRADPSRKAHERERVRIRSVAASVIVNRHKAEYLDLVAELTAESKRLRS